MGGIQDDERLRKDNEPTLEDNIMPMCENALVEPHANPSEVFDPHTKLA